MPATEAGAICKSSMRSTTTLQPFPIQHSIATVSIPRMQLIACHSTAYSICHLTSPSGLFFTYMCVLTNQYSSQSQLLHIHALYSSEWLQVFVLFFLSSSPLLNYLLAWEAKAVFISQICQMGSYLYPVTIFKKTWQKVWHLEFVCLSVSLGGGGGEERESESTAQVINKCTTPAMLPDVLKAQYPEGHSELFFTHN